MLEINGIKMAINPNDKELIIKCRAEGGYLSFDEWLRFLKMRASRPSVESIERAFGLGHFPKDRKFLHLFSTMLYWDHDTCVEVVDVP